MANIDDETLLRALRGVLAVLDRWGAGEEETRRILGAPSAETLAGWRAGCLDGTGEDTVLRLGTLLAIEDALSNLPERAHAVEWLNKRNPHLRGKTPLAVLASGDLHQIAAVNQAAQSAVSW
ncbi:MAG TPA: antitoxin Xre/MbcA/ParS toxin-binding domain-containing protein [Azospirillaceae bacterium]|nr:antitoxin Xre/MbcA/ParS toxin-binding domain-containing protein [Azospirillaceae bacterium]